MIKKKYIQKPLTIGIIKNKPNQLNQSITENNIKNNLSADIVETKPSLRKTKTKTTRPSSVKKNKITKKKSPNKNKKNPNKNTKKR